MLIKNLVKKGFFVSDKKQTYSVQFKMEAQATEPTYREVTNRLRINNPALIANWMRNYLSEGLDGFSKLKGHPKHRV